LVLFVVLVSGCTQNQAQTPGCMYVYRTSQDYFDYTAAIANNRPGNYTIVGWPINYEDKKLAKDYILGGGGCLNENQSLTSDWVILNIKKSDLYNAMGYPGCLDLEKQKYPQCYGDVQYKQGQNPECDAIYEQERSSDTSICPSYSATVSNILAENVITEFYVCKYSAGTTAEDYNKIISDGQLDTQCTKLV
ncbi:MAG: hypothetical protein NT120_00400, partial [Candidatus Aenigmarchaeota archaeon]|nr:hypothetical protein [Candidatus Aenigmarchaeota archaeon]